MAAKGKGDVFYHLKGLLGDSRTISINKIGGIIDRCDIEVHLVAELAVLSTVKDFKLEGRVPFSVLVFQWEPTEFGDICGCDGCTIGN